MCLLFLLIMLKFEEVGREDEYYDFNEDIIVNDIIEIDIEDIIKEITCFFFFF